MARNINKSSQFFGSGIQGFENLMYQGQEIKPQKTVDGVAYFEHLYLTDFTGIDDLISDTPPKTTSKKDRKKKRHFCLPMGYWCLKNFIEHPLDIIRYVKMKMHR